jgi:hypothetical protein
MKKIVLSVMAVVQAPDSGVGDRSAHALAPDPLTPAANGHAAAPGRARRADLAGALHPEEAVRVVRAPHATVH